MTRNFEIMTSGPILSGGIEQSTRSHFARDTQRDSSFLSASPPFERSEVAQALIDVFTVWFWFLLASVAGLGIALSFLILFPVRLA